ncbi:MAG: lysine--tRNA ligase [Thermoplasmata archaeon]|nr:MAG: lysine--tRNA ligase [Thermoplasmata archaeon]
MHWADVIAKDLAEKYSEHRIATGITPSGPIHVGNMREILTADFIRKALQDIGEKAEVIFVGDTIDPLRRRYPFLPDEYEKYVKMPLYKIPCPCGGHKNYAEHYLEPFISSLKDLGVQMKVVLTHEMYANGMYADAVDKAMKNEEKIANILEGVSSRKLPEKWHPYAVRCESCGRIGDAEIIDYTFPKVHYRCSCGYEGQVDVRRDEGKLLWRIDWPARWSILGITCEPFGKDHATSGGSYDTGKRICEEVFGYSAPYPVVYEWVQLKGKGAMSASKGIVFTIHDALNIVEPEVLRFMIARVQPSKHIDFDPGLPILDIVHEYDECEKYYFGLSDRKIDKDNVEDYRRAYELSCIGYPVYKKKVPYRHLVNIVQIRDDIQGIKEILNRCGMGDADDDALRDRIERVKNWVEKHAPERLKFSILPSLPQLDLSTEERNALCCMVNLLENIPWKADKIHSLVYECASRAGVEARSLFSIIYSVFLGKDYGPRLGYFLSYLGREFVVSRIREAVGGSNECN